MWGSQGKYYKGLSFFLMHMEGLTIPAIFKIEIAQYWLLTLICFFPGKPDSLEYLLRFLSVPGGP
jgi:hypothetical protein